MTEQYPDWTRAKIQEERRQAREAAAVFVAACKTGDGDRVARDVGVFESAPWEAWCLAMVKIAKLPRLTPSVQAAFLGIWIESKMLSRRVGNRRVLSAALRVLLPPVNYSGPPLLLYRGARGQERRRRLYGFSWTMDLAVARGFAKPWAEPVPGPVREGIILQTLAPPDTNSTSG
jgi:hypothetical protein